MAWYSVCGSVCSNGMSKGMRQRVYAVIRGWQAPHTAPHGDIFSRGPNMGYEFPHLAPARATSGPIPSYVRG